MNWQKLYPLLVFRYSAMLWQFDKVGVTLLAFAVAGFIWFVSSATGTMTAMALMMMALFLFVLAHRYRPDKSFILLHAERPTVIFLQNYTSMALLIVVIYLPMALRMSLLFSVFWHSAILVLIIAQSFLLMPRNTRCRVLAAASILRRLDIVSVLPLPMIAFEWHAGLRQTLFIPLWLAMIVLNTALTLLLRRDEISIIASVFSTLIVCGFYDRCEPRAFVEVFLRSSSAEFLTRKILAALILLSIVLMPFTVTVAIVLSNILLALLTLGVCLSIIAIVICAKYRYYQDSRHCRFINAVSSIVATALAVSTLLFPPLFILALCSVLLLGWATQRHIRHQLYAPY